MDTNGYGYEDDDLGVEDDDLGLTRFDYPVPDIKVTGPIDPGTRIVHVPQRDLPVLKPAPALPQRPVGAPAVPGWLLPVGLGVLALMFLRK